MKKTQQGVLAALVAGLLIGAAATFALAGSLGRTTTTTTLATITSTTTVTASEISTIQSATGSTGLVTFYKTNGDWNFTVTLNSTTVERGRVIAALLNLTNISGQNQAVHVVGPLYNPTVYSQNGTAVWCSCPSEFTFDTTWTPGPGVAQKWDILTSTLPSGQTYVLNIWPFIGATNTAAEGQYLIGEDLMINATFTVV
jgi:hypothetical protein